MFFQSLETLDNGKPYLSSVGEMGFAIDTLQYYAGWCDKIQGKTIPTGMYALTSDKIGTNYSN